jgi:hypothetical protein
MLLGAFSWYTYEVLWLSDWQVEMMLGTLALSLFAAVWLRAVSKFSLPPVLAVLVVLAVGQFWAVFKS